MPRVLYALVCCAFLCQACQKQDAADNKKDTLSVKQQTTGKDIRKDTTKKTGNERIDNQDVSKEKSPVEAKYTVGDTRCEIKREVKVYWVIWSDGHKNQLNLCNGISDNKESVSWCEHTEKDTATIGAFIFENWNHDDGVYFTSGGKELKITREDRLK